MIGQADALLSGSIDRLRAGVQLDSYDDPVESWDTSTVARLIGASVQPLSSTERETASADEINNTRHLYLPGVADLTSADRVRIAEEIWRVDGEPVTRYSLATGPRTTARLRRVESR